jgi:hypothetical protein
LGAKGAFSWRVMCSGLKTARSGANSRARRAQRTVPAVRVLVHVRWGKAWGRGEVAAVARARSGHGEKVGAFGDGKGRCAVRGARPLHEIGRGKDLALVVGEPPLARGRLPCRGRIPLRVLYNGVVRGLAPVGERWVVCVICGHRHGEQRARPTRRPVLVVAEPRIHHGGNAVDHGGAPSENGLVVIGLVVCWCAGLGGRRRWAGGGGERGGAVRPAEGARTPHRNGKVSPRHEVCRDSVPYVRPC